MANGQSRAPLIERAKHALRADPTLTGRRLQAAATVGESTALRARREMEQAGEIPSQSRRLPWSVSGHDPAPARMLLDLFCEERTMYADRPDTFESRWRENTAMVLAQVPDRFEREGWATAFRWSKEVWREAYLARGSNRLAILTDLDGLDLHEDVGDVAGVLLGVGA